jgi:putative flippase GtrA
MASLITGVYRRFAGLIGEFARFGVVGGIGTVVDLGGAGYLHGTAGIGPLSAKAISLSAATVITYAGNRFWAFRHRDNHPLLRELTVFVLLNAVGLVIAEATIGFTFYVLGLHGTLAFNLASIAGTGLGTVFRFWSYKRWVFIAPATLEGALPEQIPDELALAGASYSRATYLRAPVPGGAVPGGAVPRGAVPRGAVPGGAVPRGRGSHSAPRRGSSARGSRGPSFRSGYAGAHRR